MKIVVFFVFYFLNSVSSLSCYSSDGNSRKQCAPSDRFCSQISIVEGGYSGNLPMSFQGCSHDVREIYDAPCENFGVSDVYQKVRGRHNSWHGILSCCNTNYCNSATTFSTFFTTIFVILINIFVFVK